MLQILLYHSLEVIKQIYTTIKIIPFFKKNKLGYLPKKFGLGNTFLGFMSILFLGQLI